MRYLDLFFILKIQVNCRLTNMKTSFPQVLNVETYLLLTLENSHSQTRFSMTRVTGSLSGLFNMVIIIVFHSHKITYSKKNTKK